MRHFIIFFFLAFLLFFSVAIQAQSPPAPTALPNLSGKWKLDLGESDAIVMGQILDKKRGNSFQETLTIEHKDPEIRVLKSIKEPGKEVFTSEYSFFTDGRLTEFFGQLDDDHYRKGHWERKKLVEESANILVNKKKSDNLKLRTRTTFELSKSGKTLTVIEVNYGNVSFKRVYHRDD